MEVAEAERRVQRLASLGAGDGQDLGELRNLLDELLREAGTPVKKLGFVGAKGGVERIESARFAVELLADAAALAERGSSEEDLAVIEWALRPAVPIVEGRSTLVGDRWRDLADRDLGPLCRRICRIDVGRDLGSRIQAGTGVLRSGRDGGAEVLTAAHVLGGMRAAGWQAPGGLSAYAVPAEEPDRADHAIPITDGHPVDEHRDIAVLSAEVGLDDDDLEETDRGIPQASALAVVGYPYFDSRKDGWASAFGFREPAGVLRIAPGLSLGRQDRDWRGHVVSVLAHDASTLSGSSGSAVVELPSLRLAGIHVGGWPVAGSHRFTDNAAIPLAEVDLDGAVG
jgi:hypothetical protein